MLATGLTDPFAMGGSATSLFVGQLAADKPLLRIPKTGGPADVLIESVSFVEYVHVKDGGVFFSEEGAVSHVPTKGGSKTVLASAMGPAGIDVTPTRVYFADYLADQLVQVDRATLDAQQLAGGRTGAYRVAAAEEAGIGTNRGLIYFSDAWNGIHRYRLYDGWVDGIGTTAPPSRAVRIFGDYTYYTIPSEARVYRMRVVSVDKDLVADLSLLGVYPEALESDGTWIYLTLETGTDHGLIVRVPMDGGSVEIVADAEGPRPAALVVDDACVYWTERESGSVFRARKNPTL